MCLSPKKNFQTCIGIQSVPSEICANTYATPMPGQISLIEHDSLALSWKAASYVPTT